MTEYENIAVELEDELFKYVKKKLPRCPNPELLTKLVLTKAVYKCSESNVSRRNPKDYLENIFKKYIDKISSKFYKHLIEDGGKLKRRIQSFNIILIIGAGLSTVAGIPLTSDLEVLLRNIGITGSNIKEMFSKLRKDKEKEKEFKRRFKYNVSNNSTKMKVTEAHRTIIRYFKQKKVVEIICFNWDDLLEKAHRELGFGNIRKINREDQTPYDEDCDGLYNYLWKFHGDVEDLEYDWIYPGMEGRVFKSFTDYIPDLLKHPHVNLLVIVGYGEKDDLIREAIIEPLEQKLETYRIGMDLGMLDEYDNYIVAPAEWIIPIVFG